MIRTVFPAILVLALPTVAQEATTAVRSGCTLVSPADSLRPQPTFPIVFVPDEDGVVNIEIESIPPFGGWSQETSLSGYRGAGYFRWNGGNQFFTPNVDTLEYRFLVEEAGEHLIRLRNQHNHADPSEENDVWYRLDGHEWIKWVDNWGTGGIHIWSFNAFLESTNAFAQENLAPGEHVLEISGRSQNFKIDSVHVVPLSVWFANATDPQSDVRRERPIIGTTFTFHVDDPYDLAGFPAGSSQAILLGGFGAAPGYPCGLVVPVAGELLISLVPEPGYVYLSWPTPGTPATYAYPIANDMSLVGMTLNTQGILVTPGQIVLTDALDLSFGTF